MSPDTKRVVTCPSCESDDPSGKRMVKESSGGGVIGRGWVPCPHDFHWPSYARPGRTAERVTFWRDPMTGRLLDRRPPHAEPVDFVPAAEHTRLQERVRKLAPDCTAGNPINCWCLGCQLRVALEDRWEAREDDPYA